MFSEGTALVWGDLLLRWGLRGAFAFGVFLAIWTLAGWARRALARALGRTRLDPTLAQFLGNALYWAVLSFAFVAGLGAIGIETSSLVALVGGVSVTIGLALKDSLGNVAAGLLLLILRPFRVGDEVVIAGIAGRVAAVELLITRLTTADNRQVVVPNGTIVGANIENHTVNARRRVAVPVSVGGQVDADVVRAAFLDALRGLDGALDSPPPEVELMAVGANTSWELHAWCATADLPKVRQQILVRVHGVLRALPGALPTAAPAAASPGQMPNRAP